MAKPKDIFLDAIEQPASERQAFVERACGADASLLRDVRALLGTYDRASTFLARPAVESVDPHSFTSAPAIETIGAVVAGRYQLRRLLGEGGFGTVFEATQSEPVERAVAVKILRTGVDDREIVRRFEAERQTLAAMDHPGIAAVLDAGQTESGRPFFVMELVDGLPLADYARQNSLSLRQRIELFALVCDAVQHAHTKGVIHRDLKPGNVLVATVDGRPAPRVIDFGIAKAIQIDASSPAHTAITRELSVMGTPAYMSPEQTTGDTGLLDTRSDVYSLGAMLYELVAGTPPIDVQDVRSTRGIDGVLSAIRDDDPVAPSRKPGALPGTRGEVDWIVLRALAKDPAQRYQSALDLADDLRRYLRGDAVLARAPTAGYLLRKFVGRHRLLIGAAAVVSAALIGTTVWSIEMTRRAWAAERAAQASAAIARANAERSRVAESQSKASEADAKAQTERAESIADFTQTMLASVGPGVARGRDATLVKSILQRAREAAPIELADQPVLQIAVADMVGGALFEMGDLQATIDYVGPLFYAMGADPKLHDEPERLRAGVTLASSLSQLEKNDEAIAVLRDVVAGFERIGDGRGNLAIQARIALAGALLHKDEFAEAETLCRAAITDLTASGKADSDAADVARNTLAFALRQLERTDEAIAMWEENLAAERRRIGDDHPATIASLINLAGVYSEQKRLDIALAYYHEALARARKVYEPDHLNLVTLLHNYGRELLSQNRIDDAAPILEEAASIINANPAKFPRVVIAMRSIMVRLREKQKRFDDAVALSRAIMEEFRAAAGPTDRRTIAWMTKVIENLVAGGKAQEAIDLIAAQPFIDPPEATGADQIMLFHAAAGRAYFAVGQLDAARERAVKARANAIMKDGQPMVLKQVKDLEELLGIPPTTQDATRPTTKPTTQP
jgi:tetratricopeptide (TPR) repeat protein